MPTYDFICQTCDKNFDDLVPFDWRSAGVKCPVCSSTDVEKMVSRVMFATAGKVAATSGPNGESLGSACSSCSSTNCSTCN
ncbi:zinc ribbon domain-containing protein [bacterium]|nr:zinc ribbon domain-containing protein [bacterium]